MSNKSIGNEPVYDARTLGAPRMFVLGLQHMFAMFGATVLVPALTGLDVATTLLFAGLGTLLFHLLAKGKVPAFLGSSFAFIGGYNAVRTIGTNPDGSAIYNNDLLAYACFGVAIAGLMYVILSTLFKVFGVKKVMRYFPPIVTGPIIIAIGLTLSSSAITNCRANWLIAIVAILIVIGFNMWGKGMAKIIPILLGVLGSYIFAIIIDPAERASVAAAVSSAKWFGLPIFWKNSVFHLFAGPVDSGILWSSVLTIVPLSLATMVEHIGDICAISSTCRLVGDLFLHVLGIHIQRQRIDIRKHQLAADGKRIRHGCGKRDGRDDNLVSWLQSSILAGNLKARCAVGQKCRASGVQIFVAHILGLANLHVQRQLCRGRGNLVQRENVLFNRFQRLVVGLALAFHHKPDDGHQILRVIVFADRSPRDFGFAGVIPEIRCFLLHLKLTPFRISVC